MPAVGEAVERSIERGVRQLVRCQREDGSWSGVYGGPLFLLPMYVAAHAFAQRPIDPARQRGMIGYLRSVQQDDGSVGLHAEAAGCMFTTALCYVALRLLGVPVEDPALRRMRRWIRDHGGPLGSASWGKFVLALLGLYRYEGLHPILPELWLLPRAAPMHPGRLWCHCRQVYLPMAYLYGRRATRPVDALTLALRDELYGAPYERIDFAAHRDTLAAGDRYVEPSWPLRIAQAAMGAFERFHPHRLRERALGELGHHIDYEDQVTHSIRIGPVNAVLNALVQHLQAPGSEADRQSFEALDGYLWEHGGLIEMNGYNSTALWDTAFALQSLLATGRGAEISQALEHGHEYLRHSQVVDELPEAERHWRHPGRGGWPFSDRDHGWPITDCTAEGLKCALALHAQVARPIEPERLASAVELLLSWQNPGGGWSTYERQRAGRWLERLNPSQVFGDIMVDYPYVECTSACLQALVAVRESPQWQGRAGNGDARWPSARRVSRAIARAVDFIRDQQRPDGSWEGSWAVCFTYGTWFAVTGLRAAGCSADDRAITRACSFLLDHQNADGGWGEDGASCAERRYVPADESHCVNTAWALLTLARAGQGGAPAARRAAAFLTAQQRPEGDWPRQTMVGVFNKTALIHYDNYRRYFPLWALAEVASQAQ